MGSFSKTQQSKDMHMCSITFIAFRAAVLELFITCSSKPVAYPLLLPLLLFYHLNVV
jgi:hypothetical protein